ncbi:transcriptional regulator, AsnC family [Sphingopyxis sp. YR583]|uniref:Lrp/AsnC family transcriptional regulator n=1 Tax=Sphingopyxis sp. YR583 TaxID=1881047 RepID=UPI0008A777B9|nr:Lrp/AsnC family transcriptional regulator [Sphingopyxis sp. YR583]SEH12981.1 transcriptional regulator, AsnC family [Sphingopyxis sp. YR583]
MSRNIIDSIDRKILLALQRDATIPMTKLEQEAGLTSTGCWRRINRMKEEGIIGDRVTLLSPGALGFALIGYVMIRTRNHGRQWTDRFVETLLAMPAIVELHRTTGGVDYLLKIVAEDMAAYNRIYRTISEIPDLEDVSAAFSMEALKATTELPL